MIQSRIAFRNALVLTSLLAVVGCSGESNESQTSSGGNGPGGGVTGTGGQGAGGNNPIGQTSLTSGGTQTSGGVTFQAGASSSGGAQALGGSNSGSGGNRVTLGGAGGTNTVTGGTTAKGSTTSTGGTTAKGGTTSTGGTTAKGGTSFTGGTTATGGTTSTGAYACNGTTTGYNTTMIQSGTTWTVVSGSTQKYSGTDTQAALTAAYGSLTVGRTTKQSILVQGDGDIPATAQFSIPSYTILNWCGTLNVSGTPSGSDRSPLYARGKTDIDIPNLKMTGSPQYGIFIRETNNVHLGQLDLRLTKSAGIGIRADSGGSASTMTTFNKNFSLDYVYGTGMGSHIVETYGIDGVKIGTVEGDKVGECGLLLNRSINAEVGLVTCTDCGTDTGYAAFRVANSVGKVGSSFPAGNIHVGKVYARGWRARDFLRIGVRWAHHRFHRHCEYGKHHDTPTEHVQYDDCRHFRNRRWGARSNQQRYR